MLNLGVGLLARMLVLICIVHKWQVTLTYLLQGGEDPFHKGFVR